MPPASVVYFVARFGPFCGDVWYPFSGAYWYALSYHLHYDAVIIGHSQFEKIPISAERQERILQEQIDEITDAIAEMKAMRGESFTIKQLEKTRKSLEARMEKLQAAERKDDVITFEQLGVDRLFVDEAHAFKNRAKRCATSCC